MIVFVFSSKYTNTLRSSKCGIRWQTASTSSGSLWTLAVTKIFFVWKRYRLIRQIPDKSKIYCFSAFCYVFKKEHLENDNGYNFFLEALKLFNFSKIGAPQHTWFANVKKWRNMFMQACLCAEPFWHRCVNILRNLDLSAPSNIKNCFFCFAWGTWMNQTPESRRVIQHLEHNHFWRFVWFRSFLVDKIKSAW